MVDSGYSRTLTRVVIAPRCTVQYTVVQYFHSINFPTRKFTSIILYCASARLQKKNLCITRIEDKRASEGLFKFNFWSLVPSLALPATGTGPGSPSPST